jgi:hypothetical protein
MAQAAFERPCAFYGVNIMISVKRRISINTFWSIFDEPICIDGKAIPKPEIGYNEEFLRKYCPWLF